MGYLDSLFDLKDKVVAITGATGQLGTATCKAFAEAGAKVIGLDVKVTDKIEGVTYFKLDISDKKEVESVFGQIVDEYGRFDVLINNAGVNTFEPFAQRSEENFDWVMDVNIKGTFFCIQTYVNLFDHHKFEEGSIVNIGSVFGVVSPDFRNYTDCDRINSEVYGASKAGIMQMSRYFAVSLADRKIKVNTVSPGGIYNPKAPQGDDFIENYAFRCPMKRMAEVTEMVGAILYLASSAASYTTGQNIVVDGGMTSW